MVLGNFENGIYILKSTNLARPVDHYCLNDFSSLNSSVNTITTTILSDINKNSTLPSPNNISITTSLHVPSSLSTDYACHLRLGHMPFSKMKTISL